MERVLEARVGGMSVFFLIGLSRCWWCLNDLCARTFASSFGILHMRPCWCTVVYYRVLFSMFFGAK